MTENILIANFLKWPKDGVFYRPPVKLFNPITFGQVSHHEEQLAFDLSWEWIVVAVQGLEAAFTAANRMHYFEKTAYIVNILGTLYLDVSDKSGAYIEIVDAVKWYNKL